VKKREKGKKKEMEGEKQEKVKIGSFFTSGDAINSHGKRSNFKSGGINRQHDVKLELQLNKVTLFFLLVRYTCWS